MSLSPPPEIDLKEDAEISADFEARVSWTFHVPVRQLFEAWNARAPLMGGFNVRRATADESLWASWVVGTNLEASFYSMGESESQLTILHSKLNDAEHVAAMTEYWRNDILRELALSMKAGVSQQEIDGANTIIQSHDRHGRPEQRQLVRAALRGSYRYAAQRDAAGKMMRATYLIFAALAGLVSIRFVLMAIGVNPHEAFTAFIFSLTAPFVRPFVALFTTLEIQGVVLELQSFVAIFSYALVGWLSGRFVLLLFSGQNDLVPITNGESRNVRGEAQLP
jgi:hypothetical protein